MTDYTDLTPGAGGWIVEPVDSDVLHTVYANSAVSVAARKVLMSTPTVRVPRFVSNGADVVPEHTVIPVQVGVLDAVTLGAVKFANRFAISIEDQRDSIVDVLNQKKIAWANSFARKLDNATLGVDAVANGTTVPFESVYHQVKNYNAGSNLVVTTGVAPLNLTKLVNAFQILEEGLYNGNLVVIAHPAFKGLLRNLKDDAGFRVLTDPLNGFTGNTNGVIAAGGPSVFGNTLLFSQGCRANLTASDVPTGNPLLVVVNSEHLILGVRDGIESAVSDQERWSTDEVELKIRARRAFALATPAAAMVIEKGV